MSVQPDLILSAHDLNQIEEQIEKSALAEVVLAKLEAELARATIVKHHDLPKERVAMGSRVTFKISEENDAPDAGQELVKILCFPADVKKDEACLSIFEPIGSALIGLAVGQQINWPGVRTKQRVQVLAVEQNVLSDENGDS